MKAPYIMLIDENETDNFIFKTLVQQHRITKQLYTTVDMDYALSYLSKCNENDYPDWIFVDVNFRNMPRFGRFYDTVKRIAPKNKCQLMLMSSTDDEKFFKPILMVDSSLKIHKKPVDPNMFQRLLETGFDQYSPSGSKIAS